MPLLSEPSGVPAKTSHDQWCALPQPFLTHEARRAGLTSRALRGGVDRGDVVLLAQGLYAVQPEWGRGSPTHQHRALCRPAAIATPGCVVSHVSAASLMRLPTPAGQLGPIRLVARQGQVRTGRRDGWRVVLHGSLREGEWGVHDEVPTTSPTRTVVDCLRTLPLADGLAVADQALRRGMTSKAELVSMRMRQRRWPGVTKARVAIGLIDGRRESWLESASVAVVHQRGLDIPVSQMWIHDLDGRLLGRVDFVWPLLGVIGEADGLGKYRGDFDDRGMGADAVARRVLLERDRERGLEGLGFGVARWGLSDLRHGGFGLLRAVTTASHRARPDQIRCLWRLDASEPLRAWPPPPNLTLASTRLDAAEARQLAR